MATYEELVFTADELRGIIDSGKVEFVYTLPSDWSIDTFIEDGDILQPSKMSVVDGKVRIELHPMED